MVERCGYLASMTLLLACTAAVPAAEKLDLEKILKQPILEKDRPLKEIQEHTESRILPMPEARTVREWEQHAQRIRGDALDRVVYRGQAALWREPKVRVQWIDSIEGGKGYSIRRLRYEAVPGLWIPALLYVPDKLEGKVPVVLNVNGHDRKDGKAAGYKQTRCINQAKRGMIALNPEWLGMGQLATPGFEHYKMNQLDLCGTSGLAPFYLSMKRGLDVLLSLEHADPNRVAVAGLSGGGWQTIVISALDERVTLSNPVAGYSAFKTRARFLSDLGDSEQTPVDLGLYADYDRLTALRAPRPTLLTFNANDNCCFRADHALEPLLEAAEPVFELYGKKNYLHSHVNVVPGNHNFEKDNRQALYRMFGTYFFAGDKSFDANEIACEDELKTKDELTVPVPSDNADFNQLALELIDDLPRTRKGKPAERRKVLREILRLPDYKATFAGGYVEFKESETNVRQGTLRIGDTWTLPYVEVSRGTPQTTTIVIADGGRDAAAGQIGKLLDKGHRVLAVDLFYFGESKISQRDFLYALLVSALGERPLGIQAAQLNAIAKAAASRENTRSVGVVALGRRNSLIALCAAAVDTPLKSVELHDPLESLKQVVTENLSVRQAPELFCFGLLEEFDIPQLGELAGNDRVTVAKSKE